MNFQQLQDKKAKKERNRLREKESRKIQGKRERMNLSGLPKSIKSLRQGQTIYAVMAFPDKFGVCKNPIVETLRVESRVFNSGGIGLFVKTSYYTDAIGFEGRIITSNSLKDRSFSTEQNSYNNHKMFTSRRKMEKYLKELKLGLHPEQGTRSLDFDWLLEDEYPDHPHY